MAAGIRSPNEVYPFLNEGLSGRIRRVGFAGKNELHRALRISQEAQQPLRIVQAACWAFCRSQSGAQSPRSKRLDRTDASLRQPFRATRLRQPVALIIVRGRIRRETCWRQCEIARAWRRRHGECSAPWFLIVPSQRFFPQASVQRSSASAESQRRHVDSVGHMSNGHFVLRPARKERLEKYAG